MSNFRFRLQSIMRLRVRERDKAGQALQQAQLAKQKLLDQARAIQEESDRQITVRSAASLGQVDVQRVIDAQRYQLTLAESIRSLEGNITLIDEEIEKRRARLVVCEQEVRVLEKLEENQRDAWEAEQALRSQGRLDEWASHRHFQRQAES